ncbi:MAG: hypothetical protein WCV72_04910 [Patescibacteria group bacterium]
MKKYETEALSGVDGLTTEMVAQIRKQVEALGLNWPIPIETQKAIAAKKEQIEKFATATDREAPPDITEVFNPESIIRAQLELYKKEISRQEKLNQIQNLLDELDPKPDSISLILKATELRCERGHVSRIDMKSRFFDEILERLKKIKESFGAGRLEGKDAWIIVKYGNRIETVTLLGVDEKGYLQVKGVNTVLFLGSSIFAKKEDADSHLDSLDLKREYRNGKNNGEPQKSNPVGHPTKKPTKSELRPILKGSISH